MHELLETFTPFDFSLVMVGQADLSFLCHLIFLGVIRSVSLSLGKLVSVWEVYIALADLG